MSDWIDHDGSDVCPVAPNSLVMVVYKTLSGQRLVPMASEAHWKYVARYKYDLIDSGWIVPEPHSEHCDKDVDQEKAEFNASIPTDQSSESPLNTQEGGDHYKSMKIQPVEYITANKLGFIEGSVVKYVSRHRNKNGAEDVKKAIHFLNLLLELEYGDE